MNILVSACLMGQKCNYKGESKLNEKLLELSNNFKLIPICPEVMGGMSTPRIPSEIIGDKVLNKEGEDVTIYFDRGATRATELAIQHNCKYAILKSNSPSCGNNFVYNGNFDGTLIEGQGIAVKKLRNIGVKVFNENEIDEFLKEIETLKIN